MHDNRTHPLLEQVPLTVSPFVVLPTATTLPYTYKTMPSALPPSIITSTGNSSSAGGGGGGGGGGDEGSGSNSSNKPRYVTSTSGGHAAHPDEIAASCRALQAHVARLQADADAELRALEARIRARELAEKRRVAPGWLDSEARLLEPERTGGGGAGGSAGSSNGREGASEMAGGGPGPGPGEWVLPLRGGQARQGGTTVPAPAPVADTDEGAELDRMFGVMELGK